MVGRSSSSAASCEAAEFFLALYTVVSLTPISAAIARSDFCGFSAIAAAARCDAGISGAPQLHAASTVGQVASRAITPIPSPRHMYPFA